MSTGGKFLKQFFTLQRPNDDDVLFLSQTYAMFNFGKPMCNFGQISYLSYLVLVFKINKMFKTLKTKVVLAD